MLIDGLDKIKQAKKKPHNAMNPLDMRESKWLSNSQLTNIETRMRETFLIEKKHIELVTSVKFNKDHSSLYRQRIRTCLFIFTCN